MTERMRISAAGLELIKTFEGLRETAVRLPDGRWTIGYGHVRTAREGLTITGKDAQDLLVHDLRPIEFAVSALIYAPLLQSQFDALVSLAFNISLGQFRESEIVRHLNAGDYLAAANGFDLWRKARINGRVMIVDALVRRRAAEKSMFLEHPSGPSPAPTPMVTPELDFNSDGPARREPSRAPMADEFDQNDNARSGPAPANDIADAVRRLAELTQEAVKPVRELALPPGASVVPPEPLPAPVEPSPPVQDVVVDPPNPTAPMTAEELARASRTVAERVSRILNGVQRKIETVESVEQPSPATPPDPVRHSAADHVREGLPDFDLPGERMQRDAEARARKLIDDTEVVELGRDPAKAFAEAERKAKRVNGHAKRVGPISGRVLVMAPWIIMLALSVLGLLIGAVDAFKGDGLEMGVPRLAGTVLAVFGVMMAMSLYFIFWKRSSDEL
jgi:GH24 family phage-related lysozyme (muramidase)